MQFSPRISLNGASENLRLPAEDLQIPNLQSCRNLWTDVNGVLQAPLPDFTYPDPPDPPCPITSPVNSYLDFVNIGAYVVALGVNGEDRRIWWSAPGRPTVWDLTEVVDTVTVKTGAGWNDLSGDGQITDHGSKTLGASAAIMDSQGLGQLSLTGNWGMPFAYAKKVNSIVSYSQGFAAEVDGTLYFLDQTGVLYGTDGATVAPVDGSFNLKAIIGGGWPPYDDAELAWDSDTQKLWAKTGAWEFLINPKNGSYTSKGAGDTMFYTGALPLVQGDHSVHIHYIELETYVAGGTPHVHISWKPTGRLPWMTARDFDLPTGQATNRIWINQMVECSPQMQLQLHDVTGVVKLLGFTVAFDDGGRR